MNVLSFFHRGLLSGFFLGIGLYLYFIGNTIAALIIEFISAYMIGTFYYAVYEYKRFMQELYDKGAIKFMTQEELADEIKKGVKDDNKGHLKFIKYGPNVFSKYRSRR